MIVLRRPRIEDKIAIEEMVLEFESYQSATDGFWFSTETFDYEAWLEQCQHAELGLGLKDGAVPYLQLVSFDESGLPLGVVNVRLRLNERLLEKGGHIGYSVRTTKRRQGYAKEQLRLALQVCVSKNIKSALVTCHQSNDASRRTILACGGILEDVRHGTERYWIDLEGNHEQSKATRVEE